MHERKYKRTRKTKHKTSTEEIVGEKVTTCSQNII